MRKRIVDFNHPNNSTDGEWLDLEKIAQVEITSENPEYPIEKALLLDSQSEWRAAQTGKQVIRLMFDQPQNINRIALHFVESQVERTQEFALRWFDSKSNSFHDIVRQQWNFNSGSTEETEDYRVKLTNVTVLELIISPDIQGRQVYASLQKLRLA